MLYNCVFAVSTEKMVETFDESETENDIVPEDYEITEKFEMASNPHTMTYTLACNRFTIRYVLKATLPPLSHIHIHMFTLILEVHVSLSMFFFPWFVYRERSPTCSSNHVSLLSSYTLEHLG